MMDLDANLQRGEALFIEGLLDEAETIFQDILRFKPDHCEALNNLGVISHSRGDTKEAERYFAAALDRCAHDLDAVMNLVDLYESEGRWEEAGKSMEKAVRQENPSAELFDRLGHVKTIMVHRQKSR